MGYFPRVGNYAAYTPTISQNGARTTSSLVARYTQVGKMVHAYGAATISNAGTAGNEIRVNLPVAPSTSAGTTFPVGTGDIQDTGTTNYRACVAGIVTSGTPYIRFFNDAGLASAVGEGPSFAVANGDIVQWNITYEAA